MNIIQIDVSKRQDRQRIIDFLTPHEREFLFLLGNLVNPTQPSFLYAVENNGSMVALCGVYPTFRSYSFFSIDAQWTKTLAEYILSHHAVDTILGMMSIIEPVYQMCVGAGLEPIGPHDYPFFELDIDHDFIPYITTGGTVRTATERDTDSIALLQRYLHEMPFDSPITDEERAQVRALPCISCIEVGDRIVSVAATNGKAITAFQILSVVTDPAFRGRGLAKAACSHIIRTMHNQGAERAILFTKQTNASAIACYQHLGFHITDRFCVTHFKTHHPHSDVGAFRHSPTNPL